MRTLTGVKGWQKTSFIDFPGTVSTVLFFSGCNLRCPYCHNPQLVNGGSDREEGIDATVVQGYCVARKGKLTGVVLSGGEPTLHAESAAIAGWFRGLGYRIKLDTNGLLPRRIDDIAPDYLALDIKANPRAYGTLLGCRYGDARERLRESVDKVRSLGGNAEIRITTAPGIADEKSIESIGRLIEGVSLVYLQPLRQRAPLLDPAWNAVRPLEREQVRRMRDLLLTWVQRVEIRGD